MKAKLKFLTKQSLDKKIKTKWFKGVNIFLLLLFILLVNIDRVIAVFGGDFESEITIYVEDELNVYDEFNMTFESLSESLGEAKNYQVTKNEKNLEDLKTELNEENDAIIVHLLEDETNYMRAEIISYDDIGTVTTQLISAAINSVKSNYAATESGLTNEQILALTSPVEVSTVLTNPDIENKEGQDIVAAGVMLIFILPCFFLILMLVQMF